LKIKLIIYSFFFLSILLFQKGSTQVTIEEDKSGTDTINILEEVSNQTSYKAKPSLAMIANLVIPGTGHQYWGFKNRAFAFFATETFLIFGAIMTEKYSNKLLNNSRTFAWMYAGTKCTRSIDDEYWRNIANENFMESRQFNDAVKLNREFDNYYLEPELQWNWIDEEYQKQYRDMRKEATRYHVASTFFLGSVLLNHLIAFIDVRIISKRYPAKIGYKLPEIQPYYTVSTKTTGIAISKKF